MAQYNKILREQDGYQPLRYLMLSSPAAAEDDSTAAQIELEEKEEAPTTVEDTAPPQCTICIL